jgi:hypothetical protein
MSKRTPSLAEMWSQEVKPKKKAWFNKYFQTAEGKKATANMTRKERPSTIEQTNKEFNWIEAILMKRKAKEMMKVEIEAEKSGNRPNGWSRFLRTLSPQGQMTEIASRRAWKRALDAMNPQEGHFIILTPVVTTNFYVKSNIKHSSNK